jgi:hypothetical protein
VPIASAHAEQPRVSKSMAALLLTPHIIDFIRTEIHGGITMNFLKSGALALVACSLWGNSLMAEQAYDDSYQLKSLPIEKVTLNASFTVRVGVDTAYFCDGVANATSCSNSHWCGIKLNAVAVNGATINAQSVPVTFDVAGVNLDDYRTDIVPQNAANIASFFCNDYGDDHATLADFNRAFGANAQLTIHDADVINP